MSKLTLNSVGNLIDATTSQTTINNNNAAIVAALDNTLSRDGTAPNPMLAPLDMNSQQIVNLPAPIGANSPLRLQDLVTFTGGGTIGTIPVGGTVNQALIKNSSTNFDVKWANPVTAGTNISVTGGNVVNTINTPTFGSVNKLAITAPATGSTLTIDDGKTFRVAAPMVLTGPGGGGTFTMPVSGTGNLVADDTTQTLINKTLTTPILTSPVINGSPTGTAVSANAVAGTLASRDASASLTATNFLSGYTTTATASGTTTLVVGSSYKQYFTGTLNQTVVLPVTSTLTLGFSFYIQNNSTGKITVQSSGANTITILLPGMCAIFSCILTSGTTAASWSYTATAGIASYPTMLGGYAIGVDFSTVADTAITIVCPTPLYRIQAVTIYNTGSTASLTTAQFGLFSSTGGAGTAVIAGASALSAVTSNVVNTVGNEAVFNSVAAIWNFTTLQFRITTGQASCSGNVYIAIEPKPSA